jgi:DNA-binding NarL/FixJ family response regulator
MSTNTNTYSAFLVEDSKIIRDNLIVAMDELADTQVVAYAESEGEAARWLREHADSWQIAVIDMLLKQGSGMGVLRACRGRSASQHAVVLTNYADQEIRDQCMALGADAVFDKSTEIDDFLAYCARH